MNPTKIEWVKGCTWNPLTGCENGCPFCYARRFAYRLRGRYGYPEDDPFRPTFHPDRLHEPEGEEGRRIFAVSMGDIFSRGVRPEWVQAVFQVIRETPQHRYFMLTKNPERWAGWTPPENLWCGVSITSADDIGRLLSLTTYLEKKATGRMFVSVEPLLGDLGSLFSLTHISWVIIGAETGGRKGRVVPELAWIERIVTEAKRHGIPVFMKDSLRPLPGIEAIWRREFEPGAGRGSEKEGKL